MLYQLCIDHSYLIYVNIDWLKYQNSWWEEWRKQRAILSIYDIFEREENNEDEEEEEEEG